MSIFRLMDYFDWLPRTWLDVSPFHGSVTMLDLGSFGVPPADPHLADFGNMPCAVSFGARRKVSEADGTASGVERHYVDLRIACDERIADSCIKELTFINTIPPLEGACSKIKYLDVSPIFADAIQRIYEENSMSVLF